MPENIQTNFWIVRLKSFTRSRQTALNRVHFLNSVLWVETGRSQPAREDVNWILWCCYKQETATSDCVTNGLSLVSDCFILWRRFFRPITEPSERETMSSLIVFYCQLLKQITVAGVNSSSLSIFWSLFTLANGCTLKCVESLTSPRGHYFASASHDRTARLWSTDQPQPLRIFAGHVSDVNVWESFVVLPYK